MAEQGAVAMHLQSITLEGYRSAKPGSPIILGDLGRFNVLIGPNNCGKSTVLRFLEVLASRVLESSDVPIKVPWKDVDRSWWWQGRIEHPIKATLLFSGPIQTQPLENTAPGAFEHDQMCQVSVEVRATKPKEPEFCNIIACADVYRDGAWHPVVRTSPTEPARCEYLNRMGNYTQSSGTDACPYKAAGMELVRSWAMTTRFFDPVRAIDRNAGRRGLVDGGDLLKQIRDQQVDQREAIRFSEFREQLLHELNTLIVGPEAGGRIKHFEVKGEDPLDLYFEREGGRPIALEYMGTGIAELTVLMADMLRNPNIRQFYLEEPECHLHPRLLRRLMARLRSQQDTQFFVTTHSNAVLDSLTSDDRVYRFGIEHDNCTVVRPCRDFIEHGRTLDALGVAGSTLLQTNCIIWVEGPSDRIYVTKWLNQVLAAEGTTFIEGSDFSFVFYGGKVLSHFAFAESGPNDFVRVIHVCRYSAVLMDKDLPGEESEEHVRTTKARVREEASKDPEHRLALFSSGREIENDVNIEMMRVAIAQLLKVELGKLSTLVLPGKRRYPEEIVEHLGLVDEEKKRAQRKLEDKVGLAQLVTKNWTTTATVPPYIGELVRFIRASRLS
ncbi:MAG: AAA family ATPase [Bryobacterales bacterium]|nr:AAA family ATPase [Bryobacterales bacterium]